MKSIPFLVLLCATVAAAAPEQWQQSVDVKVPGITRLELPPATLGASQSSLADLRLIAPDGVETPYLLEDTTPPHFKNEATTDFKAALLGNTTVLTARNLSGPIEAVILESPASGFLKSLHVEGSRDGTTWQSISTAGIVFRQTGGVERMHTPVTPGDWPQLRVTLDDGRTPPVAFTGLIVSPAAPRPEIQELQASIIRRDEVPGETRLTLGLGAKNLNLSELILDLPEGVFSRHCKVSFELPDTNGANTLKLIGSGTIYRVPGEHGDPATSLTIPLNQRVPTDSVIVTIAHGDSPPLDVQGATATRFPDRLLFFASQAGPWKLLTGNRHATTPDYDLARLRNDLIHTPANNISPGSLTVNPDYQPPTALPGVDPAGSEIDLGAWRVRRAIHAKPPGVVRIELDALALAHLSRSDLGDLRLVQNDKQVPWLLEPSPPLRTLQPQITADPDPKRPTVSIWKIQTPTPGLPLHQLDVESPDPLFTRSLNFIQHGKDDLGNPWSLTIATRTWTKTPGGADSANTLHVALGDTRVSDNLWIETDNGDNPPIRLDHVVLQYRAPAIIAKITDAAPLSLYYDNPHASLPVYDLSLVRAELLASDKQPATLGEEIRSSGKRRDERDLSAGSPWLWAALALVVVGLLFIVAKMLPKEAEAA